MQMSLSFDPGVHVLRNATQYWLLVEVDNRLQLLHGMPSCQTQITWHVQEPQLKGGYLDVCH